MRQVHKAGDKLFVDYSGKKPEIVDPSAASCVRSNSLSRCSGCRTTPTPKPTETQRSADFIASHRRALEYLGGSPALVIPHQLKTGIRDACRYEPILQRT
jgi:hypothetical protein